MKKLFSLSNDAPVELEINSAGQVRPEELIERGFASDISEACELLDVAPSQVRYGWVRSLDPFEKLFGQQSPDTDPILHPEILRK